MGEDCCEVTVLRLRRTLKSCVDLTEAGDLIRCYKDFSELAEFLNSVSEDIVDCYESTAFEILTEMHQFVTCSSQTQAAIDAASFVLPKLGARFGCASQRCLEMAESVVEAFTAICNPREMLPILSEALDSAGDMFRLPAYFIPLLAAFPKVLVSLRRRPLQQVEAVLPTILKTLNYEDSPGGGDDDDDAQLVAKKFQTLNSIADSIKTLSLTLEGDDSNRLRALLSLFILQTLALLSIAMNHRLADCLPLVIHLSQLLPYCGLSYTRLITEAQINDLLHMAALGDDQDGFKGCFSHVRLGASLTVIWGFKCTEVAIAAGEDLSSLVHELQTSWIKRWEAIGVLKHVFLCFNLPSELKQQTLNFLLSILGGNSSTAPDQDADCSENTTSIYATLQAVQMLLMFRPNADIRKNAFVAFKKLLADLPTSPRFDILRAMIQNSDSSSMIGLLVDCVRAEMLKEKSKRSRAVCGESGSSGGSCFWSGSVLELVELILRPPGGGPPLLPDSCDAVSAALNLYRFILITESTGKTNYTGILGQERLKKIHSEWLLPLRTLVMGVAMENDKHGDELACGLNPIEFVLFRCIELTEQHLKR